MAKLKYLITQFTKRYRLSVSDTNKLNEVYTTWVSKFKMWAYIVSIFLFGAFFVAVLFFFTPFKYLVPGFPSRQTNKLIVHNNIMIDSLAAELQRRDQYFRQIQTVISGGIIEDEPPLKDIDVGFIEMTPIDSTNDFENLLGTEKYKFSYTNRIDDDSKMANFIFFPPVKGYVVNRFGSSSGHFGTDIVGDINAPISAALAGTVIFAEWSVTTGYVIHIQHDYSLVSTYKHNAEIFVKPGDRVKAGDLIAIMGNEGEYSTGPHLHFELWQNGIPLDAELYINF
ncbi:MAG TPA: M23 family metallopeptidase [Prolixibacteraceae bacterium]|nr:M23 family metallopeptidase [Prolixibacteraceae bacterium]